MPATLPLPLPPPTPLGERLAQLRTVLAADPLCPAPGSRKEVARAAGLTPAALARLEESSAGTAASLATVLAYYQELGVNLAWVLVPDNADVPLHAFRDVHLNEKLVESGHALEDLRRLLRPAAAALAAGQPPTAEALGTLLEQVQRGIHRALVHVLPPIRLVESAADLRAYQRRLPPVPAASAGWRSQALHVAPYHYYEAGESLPRCGVPAYYLTYEAGPENPSVSIKCLRCRAHVGEVPAYLAQPRARTRPPR